MRLNPIDFQEANVNWISYDRIDSKLFKLPGNGYKIRCTSWLHLELKDCICDQDTTISYWLKEYSLHDSGYKVVHYINITTWSLYIFSIFPYVNDLKKQVYSTYKHFFLVFYMRSYLSTQRLLDESRSYKLKKAF